MEDITKQFNYFRAKQIPPDQLAKANKQSSIRFKASLSLVVTFFLSLT